MKLNYVVYVGMIFFMVACQKAAEPYQLSDEKWANLLADIHISESATQHLSLSLRDSMVTVYLDQILEIHEVPKNIFELEYSRLKKDPAKLRIIYARITKRLSELKLKEKENKKKDKVGTKKK